MYSPAFHDGIFGLPAAGAISSEAFPAQLGPYPGREIVHRDPAKNQSGFLWPQMLPGGSAVLFTIWTGSGFDNARIAVARLPSGQARPLVAGMHGRYVASGHIVFARGRSLLAASFDLKRLELSDTPVPVLEQVLTSAATGAASFDVSNTGTLAYVPATNWGDRPLISIDKDGSSTQISLTKREFSNPRLCPDGRQLVARSTTICGSSIWSATL